MSNFTLQILHHADFEGNTNAIEDAPRLAALMDYFDDTQANTLKLSGGDNWIPSPWYNAQTSDLNSALQQAYEAHFGLPTGSLTGLEVNPGSLDQAILNLLGIQASALGNHDFDAGPNDLAAIIGFSADAGADGQLALSEVSNVGSLFPYLSSNLDFSAHAELSDLYTATLQDLSQFGLNSDLLAPYATVQVGGETIGLIGATTQRLQSISSPGAVSVIGASDDDMALLASQIQVRVDELSAQGVNKIILMSHLQEYSNEQDLAGRLTGVDIILSAGSDAIFADSTDSLKPGHQASEAYPLLLSGADGAPVLQINTDGQYHYLGRLLVEFDAQGRVIPSSIDPAQSGAYATTDAVVSSLYGSADPYAEGSMASRVMLLTDAVDEVIGEKLANVAGYSNVFLDGQRGTVRNQESNLGNLTADANLYAAEQFLQANPTALNHADAPLVSLKNGGGIRAEIGLAYGVSGPEAPVDAEITQLAIETSLAFNNGLVLYSTTVAGLRNLLEHGIANAGETSGRFPQVSGLSFSYDASQAEGSKIQSLAITDAQGQIEQLLFAEGDFVLPAESPINLVTLNFLADGDGDGYPFAANQQGDLVPLYDPEADAGFSTPGYEQQAFYDYLQIFHATAASAYNQVETSMQQDSRIQSLASRSDGLDAATPELSLLGRYETGLFDQSAAEITAYDADSGYLLTVNALAAQVDLLSLQQLAADAGAAQIKIGSVDLSSYGAGVNSVAVHNGLAAVAVEAQEKTDNGSVVLFRLADIGSDGSLNSANIKQLSVGALPDMLTFSADGSQLLVANEGEPNDDYSIDPLGSVSVIDMSVGFDNLSQAQVTTLDFSAFNDQQDALQAEGVRIFGRDATVASDLEPEYIALSADGSEAIVGLQENNAIARIDLSGTPRILDIIPLGLKDHSLPGNELDSSDKDQGIDIANAPVFGMYQPDAVVGFSVAGTDYYLFANEGDSRDYDGFSEEARVKDLTLDPTRFADAASLQADDQLGRLQVSTEGGADSDGDGDIDQLLAYGGRSISIRSADGQLVWDSGSLIEQAVAQYLPEYFNASNDDNELDSRSDNKGPEPEGLAVGQIGDQLFAFVGLERVSGVMTFNISDPANPYLVGYSNHRDFSADVETAAAGDLGPEGLTFIDALDSPSGQPLLVVANEVSGSISLYQISAPSNQARFDAASGQLILPELSLNSALADSYQARFNLVNSSQTIQLQLDLTSLSAVENNPLLANAVFSNGRLDIPQVEILGQHYAVELQLIGDNYLFELSSFSLL